MKKPKVVLTYPFFPEIVKKELAPFARVVLTRNRAELEREIREAQGLITLLSDRVDAKLLAHAPLLKVVGNFATGVNNIDLKACHERGVKVVNTPDVLTHTTAVFTLTLLLAAARRLPEGESMCRQNRFTGWTPEMLLGQDLKGRHAVIVGPGRIGREAGKLFRALGLRVSYLGSQTSALQARSLLTTAQVLSLHIPLTPRTQHWLDAERLALLPSDAIVLNTSRGPVIDEKALIQALKKRKIFAAGLDVFEREPRIPEALRRLPNVVLAPHLGSATRETREAMARLAVSGVVRVLHGKRAKNEVNTKT